MLIGLIQISRSEYVELTGCSGSVECYYDSETTTLKLNGSGIVTATEKNVYSAYKTDITKVIIEGQITEISSFAFEDFTELAEVDIQSNLTKMGWYVFANSELQEIFLPKTVETLDSETFLKCFLLKAVNVEEGNLNFFSDDGVLYQNKSNDI